MWLLEQIQPNCQAKTGHFGSRIALRQAARTRDAWLSQSYRSRLLLASRFAWLECCDHLSEIILDGERGIEIDIARKASDVFELGMILRHNYDFGTTSETDIKVLSVSQGKPVSKYPIYLLARKQTLSCHLSKIPLTALPIHIKLFPR
jgi:hypothetical protein